MKVLVFHKFEISRKQIQSSLKLTFFVSKVGANLPFSIPFPNISFWHSYEQKFEDFYDPMFHLFYLTRFSRLDNLKGKLAVCIVRYFSKWPCAIPSIEMPQPLHSLPFLCSKDWLETNFPRTWREWMNCCLGTQAVNVKTPPQ